MKQDQYVTLFNSAAADTSTNSDAFKSNPGIIQGSIHLTTDSAFNGTTSTAALQGSNDGGNNWATVYADDGTTPMTFTMVTSSNYVYGLKRVLYHMYRIVYTKGDASAGTFSANFIGK